MSERVSIEQGKANEWVRDFGKLFEVVRFIADPAITDVDDVNEECLFPDVELRLTEDACLLAIDGQHRLVALQGVMNVLPETESHLYSSLKSIDPGDYSGLKVPVTVIYIPSLHDNGKCDHLTLAEAFRQVFVDINRNARTVNESRNVLLDEHDINSIFTRTICSFIQGKEGSAQHICLDCVEWDKLDQENQLTRPASMTNVIFVKQVCEDLLGDGSSRDDGGRLRANLGLDSIRAVLETKDVPYKELKVTCFTYEQKKALIDVFEKKHVEAFVDLLSSLPGLLARQKLVHEIRQSLLSDTGTPEESLIRQRVLEVLFGGPEQMVHLRDRKVKAIYSEQVEKLRLFDVAGGLMLVRTKMFQLAFFRCIFEVFASGYVKRMSFSEFTQSVVPTLRGAVEAKWKEVFGGERSVLDKYGLDRYGVAAWKIDYVKNIIFLMLTDGEADFINNKKKCREKRREYSTALWKAYKDRISELEEEDQIRGSQVKSLIIEGKKVVRSIAGSDFVEETV